CVSWMLAPRSAATYLSMDRSTCCAERSRGVKIGASRVSILGRKRRRSKTSPMFLFNAARSLSMARTFGQITGLLTRLYRLLSRSELFINMMRKDGFLIIAFFVSGFLPEFDA